MQRILHRARIPWRISNLRTDVRQCKSSIWWPRHVLHARRPFVSLTDVPTVLLPPVMFVGLGLALWTWKCLMMIVFQNKIIYMPGLPPNARLETIEDYQKQCGKVVWREERVRAQDGTRIALIVGSVHAGPVAADTKQVYILYFQGLVYQISQVVSYSFISGNASSLPPRLPFLSPVMRSLRDAPTKQSTRFTMVCCSYRGYWTSSGSPSEKGIILDAIAAQDWIGKEASQYPGKPSSLIIWGQSIGAGVATSLAAQQNLFMRKIVLKSLILETPFISIKSMLETLYPQRWLPYRHLWPFLRNHLDSHRALGNIREESIRLGLQPPNILILQAGKDELVPSEHGDMLEKRCRTLGIQVHKEVIASALHTEALVRPGGRLAVVNAIHGAAAG